MMLYGNLSHNCTSSLFRHMNLEGVSLKLTGGSRDQTDQTAKPAMRCS
jgi:hypothetical protein